MFPSEIAFAVSLRRLNAPDTLALGIFPNSTIMVYARSSVPKLAYMPREPLVVPWTIRYVALQLVRSRRLELLFLVPDVCILCQLLDLGKLELGVWQHIINTLCIVRPNVVDLCKVLLL
jgi:hypothetical protein